MSPAGNHGKRRDRSVGDDSTRFHFFLARDNEEDNRRAYSPDDSSPSPTNLFMIAIHLPTALSKV